MRDNIGFDEREFARELSNLCRKYGVGLAGEPAVFLLEREDYSYDYAVVDDRLIWGASEER